MQKTMKKKDIRDFYGGLNAISNQGEQHRRFAYAIARNLAKTRGIMVALEEATKPVDGFDEKRIELAKEMSQKDDNGNPVELPGGLGLRIADMAAFNRKLEALREETGQKKKDEEIKELYEEEEEVDIYMVDYDLLPEKINPGVLSLLMPMVREPSDDESSTLADAN